MSGDTVYVITLCDSILTVRSSPEKVEEWIAEQSPTLQDEYGVTAKVVDDEQE